MRHCIMLLLLGASAPLFAQEPQVPAPASAAGGPVRDSVAVYRGDAGELELEPPRMVAPDVRIDGALDEPVWSAAAKLTGFTQYEPIEGRPALDDTDVYVFYTSDALYVGVRAHDRAPEEMRAKLGERDRAMMTDDWIRIMLDTFDDQRQSYVFYLTPLGIQSDGIWIEGGTGGGGSVPIDFNPDFIWASETRLLDDGWSAELRIPYISLRFRTEPVQSWGFNVARETRRNGYKTSWAPLTQNRASTLAQIGKLRSLRDLEPRRLVEVNPVVTGRRTGALTSSGYEREGFTPELGINARVGVTQNLVLDGTLNPDFSQVEADADQITANERFAISLPEKRPFFLEGTEVFQTPQRLVYTRSIVEPVGGAKLTGKVGSFNVGYLGVVDEGAIAGQTAVNLLRVRRDIGGASTIGVLMTDRTATDGGDYNRVVGVDARVLLAQRYTITTQLAGSWNRAADEQSDGMLSYLQVERSGETLGWEVVYEDVAPDFRAGSGFIRRVGDARLFGTGRLVFRRPQGSLLERWGAELRLEGFYPSGNIGGQPIESEIELQPNLFLRGGSTLRFILRRGYYALDPDAYADHRIAGPDGTLMPIAAPGELEGLYAFAVMPQLRPNAWLQIGGRMYLREIPIFTEGSRGFELLLNPDVRVWPTDGLSLELSYARSRIHRQDDDALFSTQDIPRLKAQYQFSRSLLARIVTQYNLQSRTALLDPTTGLPIHFDGIRDAGAEGGSFGAQLLVAYEPSPGTLFYAGWAQQMRGERTLRLDDMDRLSDGLFVKLSYLYRR